MKPSTRIDEITDELLEKEKLTIVAATITAIINYLDEEYEKGACSRGEHEFRQEENLNVCQKCHIITSL